jgi:cell division protein FtsN
MATKSGKTAKNSKKSGGKGKKPQKLTFTLSWTGLCSVGLLFLLFLVWAFILGVLTGRGYRPETIIPQVAQVLPGQESSAERESAEASKPDVLKPEELGFFESLQKETRDFVEAQKEKAKRAEARDAPEPAPSERQPERPRYAYLYQVAAFRSQAKAGRLESTLEKNGFDPRIEKVRKGGTDWFRIYVPFTGDAQEARQVKHKLQRLGLSDPFIRSKRQLGQ